MKTYDELRCEVDQLKQDLIDLNLRASDMVNSDAEEIAQLEEQLKDCHDTLDRLHAPTQEMIEEAGSALLNNGAEGSYEEVQSDARIAYFSILKSILDKP